MDGPDEHHQRPPGVDDATVTALGQLSKARECCEAARGHLYQFHRLTGNADHDLQEAVAMLREAGHAAVADTLDHELVGRNVLRGRWTFQIVEEYEDDYYATFRRLEAEALDRLADGKRHLAEAEEKEATRTRGHPSHTALPGDE